MNRLLLLMAFFSIFTLANSPDAKQDNGSMEQDPFLFLEDVESPKALGWVDSQNAKVEARLVGDPRFSALQKYLYDVATDPDKLALGTILGDVVFNFWEDDKNPRGVLRRTSLTDYRSGNPKWEVVLDLDQLSKDENVSWYYAGISYAPTPSTRVLVHLSRDGRDAATVREFDLATKNFVKDGFVIPESKSHVAWFDENHLMVSCDEGLGSLNKAGYPIILRLLGRHVELKDAPILYRGNVEDVGGGVMGSVDRTDDGHVVAASIAYSVSFEETHQMLIDFDQPTNAEKFWRLPIPNDASYIGVFKGDHIVMLKKAWPEKNLPASTLIALTRDEANPHADPKIKVLFESQGNQIVEGASISDRYLYVSMLDNIRSTFKRMDKVEGQYVLRPLNTPHDLQVSYVLSRGDTIQIQTHGFLQPHSIHVQSEHLDSLTPPVYRGKSRFDASKFEVLQHQARSLDGTMVPYFLVQSKNRLPNAGPVPLRIYAYGGFSINNLPTYLSTTGKYWLEDIGGAYVLANIRGGAEFGSDWHRSAMLTNRNKSFEDLIAVGEDLVSKGVTIPKKMGIEGGSNGGLLTSAVAMMRPDLFNAVVSDVPLTDMLRFHLLFAGASWMEEYGNPDIPEIRNFWKKYGPYQNVKAGLSYPELYLTTSTADDRVHPAHARKMAALSESLGHSVLFYENREGGHGGAADAMQEAKVRAQHCVYLIQKLHDA